ncbi:MAG: PQQ-binding-like beta-propeller repeat protein [Chloroflexota bacterium]|nr:PQQ-binding-like beta-propeller repeat protein [Chloroflexota bacterium]
MTLAIRTCPTCGQTNRATDDFCPNCGASLAAVQPTSLPPSRSLTFYAPVEPRFGARPKRRRNVESAGGGLVSVGLLTTVTALLTSFGPPLGPAIWAGGLLLIVAGFWRMRHDHAAFNRAGIVTTVGSVFVLGVVVGQGVDFPDLPGRSDRKPAVIAPEPTAELDWGETSGTASVAAPPPPFAAAPMFRGGPSRIGEDPGPGPQGDPTLLWRADTAGEIYSSPAVAGGMVYLGSKSGFLHALDATTGAERWRFDLGDYIVRASPAVANDTVYITSGFSLFAIDAKTGKERWRVPIRFAGQSSPAVIDGVVFVSSHEGLLYAVDAATGIQRWQYQTDSLVFSSPAVAEGSVFFGGVNGDLYALDVTTGRPRWRFATGGDVYASPAVADGVVYVSSNSRVLYALDAATGEPRWQFAAGGESSPAVVGGVVYAGSDDGGLYALDAATGEVRWLYATGAAIRSSPTVADGAIYVGSGDAIYAVDATGQGRWRYPTKAPIESSPAVVGGIVYVGSRDGFLYAVGGTGTAPSTPGA